MQQISLVFRMSEIFVKIVDNVRGDDIFIVQSVAMDPNNMLMELLIMIDAAKRASAQRITAVFTLLWICTAGSQGSAAGADCSKIGSEFTCGCG